MLPVIVKPPVTRGQKRAAIAIAGIVDLLQVGLLPALGLGYVLDDVLDVFAAIILTAICGFKWQFVLAFGLELVPFFDLLPTWTAVALLLPVAKETQPAGLIEDAQRVRVTPVRPEGTPGSGNQDVIDVEAVVLPPVRISEARSEGR